MSDRITEWQEMYLVAQERIEELEARIERVEVLPDKFLGSILDAAGERFQGGEYFAVKATLEGCAKGLKIALEKP